MGILQILLIASIGLAVTAVPTGDVEGKRLIKTSEEQPGQWMTESEIFGLIKNGQTFMDITDYDYSAIKPRPVSANSIPSQPRYQEVVRRATTHLNLTRVQDFVREFSSYYNRYYDSATGRSSQLWLMSEVEAALSNYSGVWNITETRHHWLQQSIIARLEGQDPTLKEEVVVFGAHLDSINRNGASLPAPGADDNASGSSAVLETLRVIMESGLRFNRTVEFHWYCAEEGGLHGSQSLAISYMVRNINVVGMLNMDVIGYHVDGINDVAVSIDNSNADMSQLLRVLTDEYLEYGWRNRSCGYACSDHASWTLAQYPAVMASEAVSHPDMHTVEDTYENMNFTQANEFIKLAIAYVVEMAEPSAKALM